MPRPAPADWMYGAAQAKSFTSFVADIDLTNQFPLPGGPRPPDLPPTAPFSGEYCHAVEGLLVSAPAGGGTLSVMMQADPSTPVILRFEPGTLWVRGLFVKINTVGTATITSVTAMWQGGPA